jgi:hypothetical protein
MNKRYGIAFVLLGILGVVVALSHLFHVPEQVAILIIACLSVLVAGYGIYLAVWLKFYSVGKHAHTESRNDNTND